MNTSLSLSFSIFSIRIRSLRYCISSMSKWFWEWKLRLRFNICLINFLFSYNSFNFIVSWTSWASCFLICILSIWCFIHILIRILPDRSLKTTGKHLRFSSSIETHVSWSFFLFILSSILIFYLKLLIHFIFDIWYSTFRLNFSLLNISTCNCLLCIIYFFVI